MFTVISLIQGNGIYSQSMGYLGDVSWTILVAKVCQIWPNDIPSNLLKMFFNLIGTWDWPTPIKIVPAPSYTSRGIFADDNTTLPTDCLHLMPIIMPVYPNENSAFRVNPSTKKIIQAAFQRAIKTCDEISKLRATWEDLFEPYNFVDEYVRFIFVYAIPLIY